MRPNLMSPRRTSGEDSILAMLERDPARKRGAAGGASGRLAWYGASAVVAIALTGTLVWLAAGNDGTVLPQEQPVLASASDSRADPPSAALPDPAPALRQVAMATTAAPPAPRPDTAAVIVDQQPAHDVPPMRLLKPAPAKPAALPPVRVPVPETLPRPAARSTPPAARPAPLAATASRPATRPATGAPARPRPAVVARNAVRPGPAKAPRGPTPAARSADGHVDADVALISAVIVHANGHAPEGSQMTELLCPNDACKTKPATQ